MIHRSYANKPLAHRILLTVSLLILGITIGATLGAAILSLLPRHNEHTPLQSISYPFTGSCQAPHMAPTRHCHFCAQLKDEILFLERQRSHVLTYPRSLQDQYLITLDTQIERLNGQLKLHLRAHQHPDQLW